MCVVPPQNNATRTETPAQARELDQKMISVWSRHPRHVIVDNSTDFKGKLVRTTDAIVQLVSGAPAASTSKPATATAAAAAAAASTASSAAVKANN
jgi:hypothetical protein